MNSIIVNFDDSIDVNAAYSKLKKQYPKARMAKAKIDLEELEDERLLALAEERLKNDTGARISFDEILARDGLTRADLDPEGVEVE